MIGVGFAFRVPRGRTACAEAGAETRVSQRNRVGCHSSCGEDKRLIQDGAIGRPEPGSSNFSEGRKSLKLTPSEFQQVLIQL